MTRKIRAQRSIGPALLSSWGWSLFTQPLPSRDRAQEECRGARGEGERSRQCEPARPWAGYSLRLLQLSTLVLAGAAGCAAAVEEPASPWSVPVDLGSARLVDLTHALDETTIYWPSTPPESFEHRRLFWGPTDRGYFYASAEFCTAEHGGTHLDAPIHFAEGRSTTDRISIERLIGPAVVVDVRRQAAADADYRLQPADVESWERRHGRIPRGALVLLRTGWSERWPDRERYLGDDTPGDDSNLHFPSYGEEAARLLIEGRGVAVLGVDTASIDYGPSRDFIVHRIAGEADVPGLENLTRLEELPEAGAWVFALPMKIGGGSGGPVRVVAVVPAGR